MISQRTGAGLAAAKARGVKLGRRPPRWRIQRPQSRSRPWQNGRKPLKVPLNFPQRASGIPLSKRQKVEVLSPHNAMALDTLAGVRGEMARLYRLGLNGKIRSDEMTRFIYALREIRAALEAEILTDVQQRLTSLSRDMDNSHGHGVRYQPTFRGG